MTTKDKMTFLEHLEELRFLLFKSLGVIVVFFAIAIPFAPKITQLFKSKLPESLGNRDAVLQILQVSEGFTLTLRIAFATAIILAAPFLLILAKKFINPALTETEQKYSNLFILAASGLFSIGCMIGYYITLPMAISLMYRSCYWIGGEPNWTMSNYIMFCLQIIVAFGIAFLMPIVMFILVKLGVVKVSFLKEHRKYAIIIILTVSMLLTPADLPTMLIMAIPLYALYELTILLSSISGKN